MTKEEEKIKEVAGLLMDLHTVMNQTKTLSLQPYYDISKELLLKFNSSQSLLKLSIIHIVQEFHKRNV